MTSATDEFLFCLDIAKTAVTEGEPWRAEIYLSLALDRLYPGEKIAIIQWIPAKRTPPGEARMPGSSCKSCGHEICICSAL